MDLAAIAANVLKHYGVIGIFLVAPIVAAVYLWRDNVRLNNEIRKQAEKFTESIDEMGKRVVAAQEKRVEDSRHMTEKMVEIIQEQAELSKDTNNALDQIKEMVDKLIAIKLAAGEAAVRHFSMTAGKS